MGFARAGHWLVQNAALFQGLYLAAAGWLEQHDLYAAGLLAEAQDERAKPLADAAAFLKTGKVDPATALPAAETLLAAAKSIPDAAGAKRAAQVSRDLLEAMLTAGAPEIAAAKAA